MSLSHEMTWFWFRIYQNVIISWKILGVYELVLGEDNQADQARAMQQQMPGGPSGQIQDEQKAFKAEWEAMKITEYRNALENVEKAILET